MSRRLSQLPDEDVARAAMEYLNDIILHIKQPPSFEHQKIYLPFSLKSDTPADVKEMLDHHHVIPEHQNLILALYRTERKATGAILAETQRGRFYTVDASKPAPSSPLSEVP